MLWGIAVALITLWMLGLVTGFTMGYFTHILLFIAIIAMLIQLEDDCSDYGYDYTGERYLKRRLISRSRKILPKLAIRRKGLAINYSPQTYRQEQP
jgi:hypothetical protein